MTYSRLFCWRLLDSVERPQVAAGLSQAHSRRLLLHGGSRPAQLSSNIRCRTIGKQALEPSDIVSRPRSSYLDSGHLAAPFLAPQGTDTRPSRSSSRVSPGHIHFFILFYAPQKPDVLIPILSLPLAPDRLRRAGRGDAHFRVTSIAPWPDPSHAPPAMRLALLLPENAVEIWGARGYAVSCRVCGSHSGRRSGVQPCAGHRDR